MLSWLFRRAANNTAASHGHEAAESVGRAARRTRVHAKSSKAHGSPSSAAPKAPAPAPVVASTGGQNAGQQQNGPNAVQKYMRYGFLLMGATVFINNVFLDPNNPDSLLNRALYPKGRGKFALKIERWEEKVANYRTAFNASTEGVLPAMKKRGRHRKLQMLSSKLDKLTPEQNQALIIAARDFTKKMEANSKALKEIRQLQSDIIKQAVAKGLTNPPVVETATETKATEPSSTIDDKGKEKEAPKKLTEKDLISIQLNDKLIQVPTFSHTPGGPEYRKLLFQALNIRMELEYAFMATIEAILQSNPETKALLKATPDVVTKIKNSFLDLDSDDYDTIMEKLSTLAVFPSTKPPRVFVLKFDGDVRATQVSRLREEITAVLNICDKERGDRVVLQLNSGGGTVTGYGLASAQLQRLRDAGLPLTICVDEVAASGGYMMASVADTIIASPFAVVGSVGVIATIPNFSERLQREGVVVEDVTAGKYKRTMTPYKKPKDEDRHKMKEDIEHVLVLFKGFLKANRPRLNVDAIATGETWQGPDALRLGLVDELRTADAYLSELHSNGHEVLTVTVKPIRPRFGEAMDEDQGGQASVLSWAQSWLANVFQGALDMVVRRSSASGSLPFFPSGNENDRLRMNMDEDEWDQMNMLPPTSTPRTIRERAMMVYDQRRNPPLF